MSNFNLVKRLTEAKNRVIYQDPKTGEFKVDYSKVRQDNRDLVDYTKSSLRGLGCLDRADGISGSGYEVYLYGPNLYPGDSKAIRDRLRGGAKITDNFLNRNRDVTKIVINYNKH